MKVQTYRGIFSHTKVILTRGETMFLISTLIDQLSDHKQIDSEDVEMRTDKGARFRFLVDFDKETHI